MIKKHEMINPNVVISVSIPNDNMIDDEYIYLCKLTNKENVLLPYHPLLQIKQFIEIGYAVTHFIDEDGTSPILVSIEKVIVYIDYYGFERTEIKNRDSKNTIVKTFKTYIQADRYIVEQGFKKLINEIKA